MEPEGDEPVTDSPFEYIEKLVREREHAEQAAAKLEETVGIMSLVLAAAAPLTIDSGVVSAAEGKQVNITADGHGGYTVTVNDEPADVASVIRQ